MAKKQRSIYEIKVKGLNDIKSLNKEVQNLNKKYDGLKKGSEGASKSTKGVGNAAKGSALGLGKLAKGAAVAGAALVAFNKISRVLFNQIKEGVQVFKGFEFEMAKVKAISGATDVEFNKLNDTAQELGRSTFFTAKEVASLQLNFSKLGFTATEVLQAQEAALLTATATGEDLARTATVIGSTIRGFGLDASESARVADVMAASFTSSALTLEKFQTSMTKVSPVAKLLGIDLEETTAIMGVLTDAGIEASIAGTSLRNIFLKLGDPSSDLAKSIGFTVNSGEDMVREFRRMRDEGINVEKMLEVVDVRQVAAISTMIEHIDKIELQTKAFRNSKGAAGEMADIIGNTLEGSVKRFQSALDGLRIVLVEKIAPFLTGIANSFADIFNKIAKFSEAKLSETLEEDRLKLIETKIALMDSNLEHEKRFKLIEKLKSSYPEYLGNIDSEKIKNDELFTSLAKINDELANKIILQEHEEKLQERQNEITEAQVRQKKQELKVRKQIAKVVDKFNLTLVDGLSLDEQADNLLRQRPAKHGRLIDSMAELSHQVNELDELQKQINHHSKEENKLLDEKAQLMFDLGIAHGVVGDFEPVLDKFQPTKPKPTPTPTGDDEEQTSGLTPAQQEIKDIELQLKQDLLLSEQAFANNTKFTREMLNKDLLELQIMHLEEMTKVKGLEFEVQLDLEMKLAKAKGKLKEEDLKQTEETEKAKSELIKANIENAVSIGSSLMQIGEIMGENSKAAKAGIAITKAASVASAISGIIDAKAAITKQAKSGDPFSAFARMAIMAAAVAPLIASLLALKGGGGGADIQTSFTSDAETFAEGGLTKGGVFVGNSHANGGVKFAVGGKVMEAEGGEAIINKKSTSLFKPMLSAINSYNGNGVKFADGGLLNSGEKFAMGGQLMSPQQVVSGGATSSNVLIVESDMTDIQKRISTIESQASF